jgi:dTDP-4-amino-4,6-dideoxy-D-galactose acyltransferase
MPSEPCQLLAWDTEFFGKRIARVNGDQLTLQRVVEIEQWCTDQHIDCLYFLADSRHQMTARLAEEHGFRFVDVRVTLHRKVHQSIVQPLEYGTRPLVSIDLRPAKPSDVALLEDIARTAYTDARFYADPCFTREQCDRLYASWIRRSCEGYADFVWVVEAENIPVGYISCHLSQDKMRGNIGLVGVTSTSQGQGVGRLLVDQAVRWFVEQGAREVSVVTQGRNVSAQRLYQRCGFVTHMVQLWYHKWFIDCEQA